MHKPLRKAKKRKLKGRDQMLEGTEQGVHVEVERQLRWDCQKTQV